MEKKQRETSRGFSGQCGLWGCSTLIHGHGVLLLVYTSVLQSSRLQQELSCAEGTACLKQCAEPESHNVRMSSHLVGHLRGASLYLYTWSSGFLHLGHHCILQTKSCLPGKPGRCCRFRPVWIWVFTLGRRRK